MLRLDLALTERDELNRRLRTRTTERRGTSRAAVAVGHTILVIACHLLRDGATDRDLGPTYFDQLDRQHVARRLVHRLHDLGYRVTREPLAAD